MSKPQPTHDWLGREIQVGSLVVYSVARSSSAVTTLARIHAFYQDKPNEPSYEAKSRVMKLRENSSGHHHPAVTSGSDKRSVAIETRRLTVMDDPSDDFYAHDLTQAAKAIRHSGLVGHLFYNTTTNTVAWVSSSYDQITGGMYNYTGHTSRECIEHIFNSFPWVTSTDVHYDVGPSGGWWIQIPGPHGQEVVGKV